LYLEKKKKNRAKVKATFWAIAERLWTWRASFLRLRSKWSRR